MSGSMADCLSNAEISEKLKAHYLNLSDGYAQQIKDNDSRYDFLSEELLALIASNSLESGTLRERVKEISGQIKYLLVENRRLYERQILFTELANDSIF